MTVKTTIIAENFTTAWLYRKNIQFIFLIFCFLLNFPEK